MRFAGLSFFTKNSYSIQIVFYFLYVNMIISLSFLVSNIFSDVKTATGLLVNHFSSLLSSEKAVLLVFYFYTSVLMHSLELRFSIQLLEHQLSYLLVEMYTRIMQCLVIYTYLDRDY